MPSKFYQDQIKKKLSLSGGVEKPCPNEPYPGDNLDEEIHANWIKVKNKQQKRPHRGTRVFRSMEVGDKMAFKGALLC